MKNAIKAGFAGGVVGGLLMMGLQQIWKHQGQRAPSEPGSMAADAEEHPGRPEAERKGATEKLAERLASRSLPQHRRILGGRLIHLAFSGTMGALYSAAREASRPHKAGPGQALAFATALFVTGRQIGVPLLKLSKAPDQAPLELQLHSLLGHWLYGSSVEAARYLARRSVAPTSPALVV